MNKQNVDMGGRFWRRKWLVVTLTTHNSHDIIGRIFFRIFFVSCCIIAICMVVKWRSQLIILLKWNLFFIFFFSSSFSFFSPNLKIVNYKTLYIFVLFWENKKMKKKRSFVWNERKINHIWYDEMKREVSWRGNWFLISLQQ